MFFWHDFAEARFAFQLFSVNIIKNTIGGDGEFSFHVEVFDHLGGRVSSTVDVFQIQTENGSGLFSFDSIPPPFGGSVSITENPLPGWQSRDISCASADSQISATSTGGSISFPISIFSAVTCTFTNTKQAEGFSNIMFIPGLEGSRLYRREPGCIFLNCENQLWEPNRNEDVMNLFLNSDGASIGSSIYTRDIIDEINISPIGQPNIYKSFGTLMNKLVSDNTIAAWKPLPYDWRFDPRDVIDGGVALSDGSVSYLIPQIEALAQSSKTGKVTIIAHSNGGVVAKELLKKLELKGEAALIDKLILVASPQLGTPKAVASLLHGDDEGIAKGFILENSTARTFGENMPGAYGLLPSRKYFENVIDPVIVFASSSLTAMPSFGAYGGSISSYDSLKAFLLGQTDHRFKPVQADIVTPNVLNETLLNRADTLHDDIDNWQPPATLKVIEVAGWGLQTVKGIRYIGKDECVPVTDQAGLEISGCVQKTVLDYRPIFTAEGDGTVVYPSAMASVGDKYYVDMGKYNSQFFGLNIHRNHSDIFEVKSVLDFLENKIKDILDFPNFVYTTKPDPKNSQDALRLSVHSPVSIDVYDGFGNHTGLIRNPDPNSDIQLTEENIPNSYYMEFGEGKYVGFEPNASTTAVLRGTGVGIFTLETEIVSGDTVKTSSVVTDIPVLPGSIAIITLSTTTPLTIAPITLDIDGDGESDITISSGGDFDPVAYLQSMKKVILGLGLDKKVEKTLVNKINNAIKLFEKNKIKKLNKKLLALEKRISNPNKKLKKKIDSNDAAIIVNMINNLLYNL